MPRSQSSLKDSKVVKVLSTLNDSECLRLKKFVYSPFFCSDKNVVKLFGLLFKAYPKFKEANLDKVKLFEEIFGRKAKGNNYQQLVSLCNTLLRLVYQYLQYEISQEQWIWQEWLMLRVLNGRVSENELKKRVNKCQNKLEIQGPSGSRDLIGKYLLADFQLTQNPNRFTAAGKKINHSINHLDDLYFTDKLKRLCVNMQLWYSGNTKAAYEDMFSGFHLNDFLAYYNNSSEKSLLSQIYCYLLKAFMALKSEEVALAEKYYQQLRKIKKDLILSIPNQSIIDSPLEDDMVDIYLLCTTLCNQLDRCSEVSYEAELFELYREQLDYGMLHTNGFLAHQHYKNLVTLALRLGKKGKAFNIIEKYENDVPIEYRESVNFYNWAHYHLYDGNFKEVHKMLIKQNKVLDPYYNIGVRTIKLKAIYLNVINPRQSSNKSSEYTFNDFELVRKNLLSHLRTSKLTSTQKNAYKNFIGFIYQFVKINEGKQVDQTALRTKIISEQPVFEKAWLLKELEKLI